MSNLWTNALKDYFRLDLDDVEAGRWWSDLTSINSPSRISNLTAGELNDAIRWAGSISEPGGKYEKKPTIRHLRSWVLQMRVEEAGRRGVSLDSLYFIGVVKSRMEKAASHDERWDVMCGPERFGCERSTTAEECAVLEAWARQKWPDFRRPAWMKAAADNFAKMIGRFESRQASDESAVFEPVAAVSACPF